MRSFATILLSLSLPLHAFAAHGINPARRHADIALRPRDSFSGVRMTYYEITVGPVACEGGHYSDSDFVVALNHPQFGDGAGTSSYCGQIITISYEGKSAQATIVDECMGCPYGGLDLTPGLFSYLAGGTSQGVIQADWSSGGAAPAPAPHQHFYHFKDIQFSLLCNSHYVPQAFVIYI
ncbi:RlpA-like double-psi beta-barrel-protein domain-containing protein-containing protein [Russula ochroleuca]|uniref:RlpA-like double-psi beta-barrel-protein domain-containing protein-containing protein n=1 Tax=Russula ochroleuca TaxID=152965 RepID=A0A9P5MU52_9AGAM|nr:RlpA-like double-psi beta-barrel-protein domain-containing protein-containing protein [Russula ochroleuca]